MAPLQQQIKSLAGGGTSNLKLNLRIWGWHNITMNLLIETNKQKKRLHVFTQMCYPLLI